MVDVLQPAAALAGLPLTLDGLVGWVATSVVAGIAVAFLLVVVGLMAGRPSSTGGD